MTLTSTLTKLTYNGDGVTNNFAINFIFWDKDDVRVILRDENVSPVTETTLTRGTEYTITGGNGSSGTLFIITPPTSNIPVSGEKLIIKSDTPTLQSTDIPKGGQLQSTSIEQQFDKNVRLVQQIEEQFSRGLFLPESSAFSDLIFPEPEAGKFLAWKTDLSGLENLPVVTGGGGGSFDPDAAQVFNDSGNAVDFRIESDNRNSMFHLDGTNDRVGIGFPPTLGLLHVQSGDSSATSNAIADELVIEGSSGSEGISVLSLSTGKGTLAFGSDAFNLRSMIQYDHANDEMIFTAQDTIRATFYSDRVVFNDPGADYDFRIEGDTSTHLFFLDASAERIGISSNSNLPTDGLLHLLTGAAGTVAASTSYDELVMEGSGTVGYSLLGSDAGLHGMAVGSATSGNQAGNFYHQPSNKRWFLLSNATELFRGDATAGVVFNESGAAALDFRIEGDTQTHLLFVDSGNDSVHIGNSLLIGASAGDLVVSNNNALRFVNNAGSSSANTGMLLDTGDNLQFHVPAATDYFSMRMASNERGRLVEENSGMGLMFIGEASADHSLPSANNCVVYPKDVAGSTELFFRNTTGVTQLSNQSPGSVSGLVILNKQVTGVGTDADTAEKTLLSYNMPANTLDADGEGVRIRVWGTTAANANTKNMRVKFGSATLYESGAESAYDQDWFFEVDVYRTGSATQDAVSHVGLWNGSTITPAFDSSLTEDTTLSITISVTGQNGTASANDIIAEGMIIEHLA